MMLSTSNIAVAIFCPNSTLEEVVQLDMNTPSNSESLEDYNITLSQRTLETKIPITWSSQDLSLTLTLPFNGFSSEERLTNSSNSCVKPHISFSIFQTDALFQTSHHVHTYPMVVSKIASARIGRESKSLLDSPMEITSPVSPNKTVSSFQLFHCN